MLRKRIISPELFASEKVAQLPHVSVVTFIGVWCYLDDYGRGVNNPALVKADVYPLRPKYTERKVAADLALFIRLGLLHRYVVNGYDLIHSPSWQEHQRISHAKASKLPPCPDHDPAEWNIFQADIGGPLEKFRVTRDYGSLPQSTEDCTPNVVEVNPIEGSSSGVEACRSVLKSVRTA